jgi:hypothetical protein
MDGGAHRVIAPYRWRPNWLSVSIPPYDHSAGTPQTRSRGAHIPLAHVSGAQRRMLRAHVGVR